MLSSYEINEVEYFYKLNLLHQSDRWDAKDSSRSVASFAQL